MLLLCICSRYFAYLSNFNLIWTFVIKCFRSFVRSWDSRRGCFATNQERLRSVQKGWCRSFWIMLWLRFIHWLGWLVSWFQNWSCFLIRRGRNTWSCFGWRRSRSWLNQKCCSGLTEETGWLPDTGEVVEDWLGIISGSLLPARLAGSWLGFWRWSGRMLGTKFLVIILTPLFVPSYFRRRLVVVENFVRNDEWKWECGLEKICAWVDMTIVSTKFTERVLVKQQFEISEEVVGSYHLVVETCIHTKNGW